jgi:hypothetical protein
MAQILEGYVLRDGAAAKCRWQTDLDFGLGGAMRNGGEFSSAEEMNAVVTRGGSPVRTARLA